MEDQYYDIERRTAIKEEARMFRRKFITGRGTVRKAGKWKKVETNEKKYPYEHIRVEQWLRKFLIN